jgi:hypothetical protein
LSLHRYWQPAAVGFVAQQVAKFPNSVEQTDLVAVKSSVPLESHTSFDFTQLSMACHWLPQVAANVAWLAATYGAEGAVSCGHLPVSEHLTSSPPQSETAITVTVITARRSLCISCPSNLITRGECG